MKFVTLTYTEGSDRAAYVKMNQKTLQKRLNNCSLHTVLTRYGFILKSIDEDYQIYSHPNSYEAQIKSHGLESVFNAGVIYDSSKKGYYVFETAKDLFLNLHDTLEKIFHHPPFMTLDEVRDINSTYTPSVRVK